MIDEKLKKRALSKINEMIYRGEIKRPTRCSQCGELGINKYHEIQGHHQDYHKPLEVIWLCRKCHMRLHALERKSKPNLRRIIHVNVLSISQKNELERKLIDFRKSMGWRKTQMGKYLNITSAAIYAMESGKYSWTPLTVAKLKKKLPEIFEERG